MQVNEWNSEAPQIMAYGGDFFFKMTQQDGMAATNGGPTGYPSMFIGANSDHVTAGEQLAEAGELAHERPTTWIWNDHGLRADETTNIWNSAYDVWFSTNPAGEPSAFGPERRLSHDLALRPAVGAADRARHVPGGHRRGRRRYVGRVGGDERRQALHLVRATEASLSLSTDLNFFIRDAVDNRPEHHPGRLVSLEQSSSASRSGAAGSVSKPRASARSSTKRPSPLEAAPGDVKRKARCRRPFDDPRACARLGCTSACGPSAAARLEMHRATAL
jgi:hypothetical protein